MKESAGRDRSKDRVNAAPRSRRMRVLGRERRRRRVWRAILGCVLAAAAVLAAGTWGSIRDFPNDLSLLTGTAVKSQVLARDGTPLSYTLENAWNTTDVVPLAAVPTLLQTAFIVAED